MPEPRFAYVASPLSLEDIEGQGGHGGTSCVLYLDPSEAVNALFSSLWNEPDDDFVANIYQVKLDELDGVWPRVNNTYNDISLQWTCFYRGKIPAPALDLVGCTKSNDFVPRGKNRYPWS